MCERERGGERQAGREGGREGGREIEMASMIFDHSEIPIAILIMLNSKSTLT